MKINATSLSLSFHIFSYIFIWRHQLIMYRYFSLKIIQMPQNASLFWYWISAVNMCGIHSCPPCCAGLSDSSCNWVWSPVWLRPPPDSCQIPESGEGHTKMKLAIYIFVKRGYNNGNGIILVHATPCSCRTGRVYRIFPVGKQGYRSYLHHWYDRKSL